MSCGGACSCGCCEGVTPIVPVTVGNRPGLSALAYRVGTHARFKETMLAALSSAPELRELTTREDDDPTIALLDSWATVLDVLTFYQERIADEGFLRTATERRSLLELARLIGYELRPGVAASTWLAFSLDGSPGSPREVAIPAGLRAQSLPAKDELPQSFETGEAILARPEWSELKPRMTQPQLFDIHSRTFYFKGTSTGLEPGAWTVLRAGEHQDPAAPGTISVVPLRVTAVEPQAALQRTKVTLAEGTAPSPVPLTALPFTFTAWTGGIVESFAFAGDFAWKASDLQTFSAFQGWSSSLFFEYWGVKVPKVEPPEGTGVFALRVRTGFFGHNAALHSSTPKEWRETGAPYTQSWEGRKVTENSQGESYTPENSVYLEQAFPAIQKQSWAVLSSKDQGQKVYLVQETGEESRADYGLSGKATRLTLEGPDGGAPSGLDKYETRKTTFFGRSDKLELADLPIDDDVKAGSLELDRLDAHLAAGLRVVVRGETVDGLQESEVVVLRDVVHHFAAGFTEIFFVDPLQSSYRRGTVTLNANVAPATHGETREEVLGNGDASRPFQSFRLRQKPLTWVSAPVPAGGESTLQLRVDGVLWHESPDAYRLGRRDRRYVLRRDDDGNTAVELGDGVHGARLPTGTENVRAVYRTGIGIPGLVDRDRITLLPKRPLGVKTVTNPVPATGGADPEARDQARRNAPLTVLTLDRVVSLRDVEDFARAFAGIAKATAAWLWDGHGRIVHLSVAGVDGAEVVKGSDLDRHLREAMDRGRDPFPKLVVGSYEQRFCRLQARVKVDPDFVADAVLARVAARLREELSFAARDFGEGVALSEVMSAMQGIEGVVAVDVDALYPAEQGTASLEPRLFARPARLDGGVLHSAQILTLAPVPPDLEVLP
jgi:hypothetical protein